MGCPCPKHKGMIELKTEPSRVRYHVFADGIDEYVDTEEQAYDVVRGWGEDIPNGAWRIYQENLDEDGDVIDEEMIDGEGDFPR